MTNAKDLLMLCESNQNEQEILNLGDNWKAQIKFDGCRVMTIKKGKDIILFGRGNNTYNAKFREIVNALKELDFDFIIDGEIISQDGNFNKLQKRVLTKDLKKIEKLEKEIPVKYMIFDILSLNNEVVMKKALKERVNILSNSFKDKQNICLELVSYDSAVTLLNFVKQNLGEGIILKNMDSEYENKRSKNWVKHKLFKETTITITAFTSNNAGIRATTENGTPIQISGQQCEEVKRLMTLNGYVNINIQYLTQSKEGNYRFPSYRGLA